MLRNIAAAKSEQAERLRQYLEDGRVSIDLAHRVTVFLKRRRNIRQRSIWDSVPELESLPLRLRKHLRYEVFSPQLMQHPLFYQLEYSLNNALVAELCLRTLSERSCMKGGDLFCSGSKATH